MTTQRGNCWYKTTRVAPKEVSIDATVASVTLVKEQRSALKAFLNGKDVLALLPTGLVALTG